MADSTAPIGETVELIRECETCGASFSKPKSESKKDWIKGHRYCSIRCGKVGKLPWNKGMKQPRRCHFIPCRICGRPTQYAGTEKNKLWGKVHCGAVSCAQASDLIKRERIAQSLSGRRIGPGWHNTQTVTKQELALLSWFTDLGWMSQYPVRPGMPWKFWLLDFADPDLRLNVEIDGSAHRKLPRRHRDAERDHRMHQLGWRVLRIPAELVDTDCETAKAYVLAWIRSTGRG